MANHRLCKYVDYRIVPKLYLCFILEELCKEQMLLQVSDVGPWVCFPETVHELYAHLAELISNFMKAVCSILNQLSFRVE